MVGDGALSVRAARVERAQVDAPGNTILVTATRSIRWAVHVAARTIARVLTSCPSVANFALVTRAPVTARYVLADCTRMARLFRTLVHIRAAHTVHVLEAGYTGAQ